MVVPRLAWRPWPRRNGVGEIDEPDIGDVGEVGVTGEMGDGGTELVVVITFSKAAATPFAGTGAVGAASGVVG